jgi:hypothetical protein
MIHHRSEKVSAQQMTFFEKGFGGLIYAVEKFPKCRNQTGVV